MNIDKFVSLHATDPALLRAWMATSQCAVTVLAAQEGELRESVDFNCLGQATRVNDDWTVELGVIKSAKTGAH